MSHHSIDCVDLALTEGQVSSKLLSITFITINHIPDYNFAYICSLCFIIVLRLFFFFFGKKKNSTVQYSTVQMICLVLLTHHHRTEASGDSHHKKDCSLQEFCAGPIRFEFTVYIIVVEGAESLE